MKTLYQSTFNRITVSGIGLTVALSCLGTAWAETLNGNGGLPARSDTEIIADTLDETFTAIFSALRCDPTLELAYAGEINPHDGSAKAEARGYYFGRLIKGRSKVESDPTTKQSKYKAILAVKQNGVAIAKFRHSGSTIASESGDALNLLGRISVPPEPIQPSLAVQDLRVIKLNLNDVVLSREPLPVLDTRPSIARDYETKSVATSITSVNGQPQGGTSQTKVCVHTCGDNECFSWTPGCDKIKAPSSDSEQQCSIVSHYEGEHTPAGNIRVQGKIKAVPTDR